MHALESRYKKITNFYWSWMDKVAAANAKKIAAVEQLQTIIEWEKKLQEEISYMIADL